MKNIKGIGKALLVAALVASSAQMFASKMLKLSPKRSYPKYIHKPGVSDPKLHMYKVKMRELSRKPGIIVPSGIYDRTMGKLNEEQQVLVGAGIILGLIGVYQGAKKLINSYGRAYPGAEKKAKDLLSGEAGEEALEAASK